MIFKKMYGIFDKGGMNNIASYFIYKMFIYEVLIQDYLLDGDCIERALGLIGTIFFGIFGIAYILLDIFAIPLYLLVGVLALIFKIIERRD